MTETKEVEIDEFEITKGNFPKVYCMFILLLLFHVLSTRFNFFKKNMAKGIKVLCLNLISPTKTMTMYTT